MDKGRTRETGVDCWGLVRLVYAEIIGVDLPTLGDGYASACDRRDVARLIDGRKGAWRRVDIGAERAFDAVLLRIGDCECHVGVVVEPGLMLHVLRGCNAVVECYGGPIWRNRVASIWRYSPPSE
jgi:cell wall-associated NlpC family hydrolase